MPNQPNQSNPQKPAAPPIRVDTIMTSEVFSVQPQMSVKQAIELLTSRRISGAPVVDLQGTVISVVSEGDLLKLAATVGLEPTIEKCLPRLPKSEKLITAKRSDLFPDVYRIFLAHPVHRVIVTDDRGKLQGIVSRSNVLKVLIDVFGEKSKSEKETGTEKVTAEREQSSFDAVAKASNEIKD